MENLLQFLIFAAYLGGFLICLLTFVVFLIGKYEDGKVETIRIGKFSLAAGKLTHYFWGGILFAIVSMIIFDRYEDRNSNLACDNAKCAQLTGENRNLETQVNDLKNKLSKFEQTGKEKCDLLAKTGHFIFHQNTKYLFTSTEFTKNHGIRATAISGSWDNVRCISDGNSGYLLEGIDTSVHEIEVSVPGDGFKYIGTAESKYKTQLPINNDGTFGMRRILHEIEMIPKYSCKEYEEQFKDKIAVYDEYRRELHGRKTNKFKEQPTQPCITAMGQDNSAIVLMFACRNYTRTMVQVKSDHLSVKESSNMNLAEPKSKQCN
ncbi:hypothetical protein [Nitrosomonas sp.]|uniref:hypothetical protein n=1 Tax=Nitrosomonas sp. TaxID=42353 RepID=UPI00261BC673|nr:hypothetical protein [Nitrosomonas sp.]